MNTIVKMVMKIVRFRIKAFSLMESLCVLVVISFLILSLSGSVRNIFIKVEEQLFFLSFEQFYRQTQRLSISRQTETMLIISENRVTNGEDSLIIPISIRSEKDYHIKISKGGGNSSLSKIIFNTQTKIISYQLYIGSGRYKKTESSSLYSP